MRKSSIKTRFPGRALVCVLLVLLAGCAVLANHEHTRLLKQAVQDNQACEAQGWRYPQPRYITCRMQLDDKRQYRNWMNLQLMSQTRFQHPGSPPTYPAQEAYRPLDRNQYQCHYISENGKDYILCSEATGG